MILSESRVGLGGVKVGAWVECSIFMKLVDQEVEAGIVVGVGSEVGRSQGSEQGLE